MFFLLPPPDEAVPTGLLSAASSVSGFLPYCLPSTVASLSASCSSKPRVCTSSAFRTPLPGGPAGTPTPSLLPLPLHHTPILLNTSFASRPPSFSPSIFLSIHSLPGVAHLLSSIPAASSPFLPPPYLTPCLNCAPAFPLCCSIYGHTDFPKVTLVTFLLRSETFSGWPPLSKQ